MPVSEESQIGSSDKLDEKDSGKTRDVYLDLEANSDSEPVPEETIDTAQGG